MTDWKASSVVYGNDVADTALRLERRLNAMQEEGFAVHSIFHASPHFIVVASRQTRKRATSGTRKEIRAHG